MLTEKVFLEEFEDTTVIIRICKSKKNRQHNDQKKRTNNDLVSACPSIWMIS
jgi:hypothetical protein